MAKNEIKKEKFAKFYIRTWSDAKLNDLNLFEERFFITSWTNLFSIKSITGIYEINRGGIATYTGFTSKRIISLNEYAGIDILLDDQIAEKILNNVIDKFNTEYKKFLEYNIPEHILFVKSYFKFQYKTIGNPCVAIRMILNDFNDTFRKVDRFWMEFGKLNKQELLELKDKLGTLLLLSNTALDQLESAENPDNKKIKEKKEAAKEYKDLIPKYDDFLKKLSLS